MTTEEAPPKVDPQIDPKWIERLKELEKPPAERVLALKANQGLKKPVEAEIKSLMKKCNSYDAQFRAAEDRIYRANKKLAEFFAETSEHGERFLNDDPEVAAELKSLLMSRRESKEQLASLKADQIADKELLQLTRDLGGPILDRPDAEEWQKSYEMALEALTEFTLDARGFRVMDSYWDRASYSRTMPEHAEVLWQMILEEFPRIQERRSSIRYIKHQPIGWSVNDTFRFLVTNLMVHSVNPFKIRGEWMAAMFYNPRLNDLLAKMHSQISERRPLIYLGRDPRRNLSRVAQGFYDWIREPAHTPNSRYQYILEFLHGASYDWYLLNIPPAGGQNPARWYRMHTVERTCDFYNSKTKFEDPILLELEKLYHAEARSSEDRSTEAGGGE